MKQNCCENWEFFDKIPENRPIAQRDNAKKALIDLILKPFAEEHIKKTIEIIICVLWLLVGLWFLISPLPITKIEFGCCWLSLLCFILLNLMEGRKGNAR